MGSQEPDGEHSTVPMRSPFDGAIVDIDTDMQPVIAALWSQRIPTKFSCQGYPDAQAHLVFADRNTYLAAMRTLGANTYGFSGRPHRVGAAPPPTQS